MAQVHTNLSVPECAEVKKNCSQRRADSELRERKAGGEIAAEEKEPAQHHRLEKESHGGGFKSLVEYMSQLSSVRCRVPFSHEGSL